LESSSSVELVAIPPYDAHHIEEWFRPLIAPALLRTRKLDAQSLFDLAEKELLQLWVAYDKEKQEVLSGAVTEVAVFSTRKVGRVLLAAGRNLNQWKAFMGRLEEWARAEGCSAIEIIGRPGWGRVYPDYELIEHTFSKEL
jgi:hypothetical protein